MDYVKERCAWVNPISQQYIDYHDTEWGIPVHDDRLHFEMITLEGAQAGLSWETVLAKRDGYREAFHNFDPEKVANMSFSELEKLRSNPAIIRNKLKIFSTQQNARSFLSIQNQFGSFDEYIWSFVNHTPIVNKWTSLSDVPSTTEISDAISKDLKKRGMSFVGSTIIYAYMQACGLVNDHTTNCFRYQDCIDVTCD